MTVSLPPQALATLRDSAAQLASLLKALAHRDRLLLLCQLAEGERNVQELEHRVGVHQPSLSQDLGVLRAESIVSARRDGKYVYYRLADDEIRQIMKTLSMLHHVAPAKRLH
ncbi:ArsR family transcriptional regulator [Burkholderia multivorans]|uniref:ArsR/SmtB family transcription factor n=1 Tax=Burkholderia multivorans TaxID=87883 RepID=UPI00075E94C1|nr:metalloregulator ArsR/SmtB family transcription factor [Burkholderia multivorans]KWA30279.1 ArsR family transcriptional regulator [Burkholderia multivorans]